MAQGDTFTRSCDLFAVLLGLGCLRIDFQKRLQCLFRRFLK